MSNKQAVQIGIHRHLIAVCYCNRHGHVRNIRPLAEEPNMPDSNQETPGGKARRPPQLLDLQGGAGPLLANYSAVL